MARRISFLLIVAALLGAAPASAVAAPTSAQPDPAVSGNPPPPPTPGPSVSGVAQVGGALTGRRGEWQPGTELSSEWIRCATATTGCETTGDTDLSYALGAADAGKALKLRVTGRRVVGTIELGSRTVDSAAVSIAPPPGPMAAPVNVKAPEILGTLRQGEMLTGSPGAWTGTAPIAFAYGWASCATATGGCVIRSHTQRYRPTAADVGRRLALGVRATNPAGTSQTVVFSSGKVVPALRRISPFPVLLVSGRVAGSVTTVTTLRLRRLPRGATIGTSCRGRGCPYRNSSTRLRKGSTMQLRRLQRPLRAGAVIVVTVRKGKTLGKYVRLRIRRGAAPARLDRCVRPGSSKPVDCA